MLFLPLYIISDWIGNLDDMIVILEKIIKEKKEEDVVESRDVSFLSFIAQHEEINDFVLLKKLVDEFKGDEEELWIDSKWIGMVLKRLELIINKRRVSGCREIIINLNKAKQKILMFKTPEELESQSPKISEEKVET